MTLDEAKQKYDKYPSYRGFIDYLADKIIDHKFTGEELIWAAQLAEIIAIEKQQRKECT